MFRLIILTTIICAIGTVGICGKKIPKKIRANFRNCYDSVKSENGMIRFDGYYEDLLVADGSIIHWSIPDSSPSHFMFFRDGTFLYSFGIPYEEHCVDAKCRADYFQRISTSSGDDEEYRFLGNWGTYRISGDTVIGHYINYPTFGDTWYSFEIRFRALGWDSLLYLGQRDLEIKDSKIEVNEIPGRIRLPPRFVKSAVPLPKSWLKDEERFNCK